MKGPKVVYHASDGVSMAIVKVQQHDKRLLDLLDKARRKAGPGDTPMVMYVGPGGYAAALIVVQGAEAWGNRERLLESLQQTVASE